MRNAIKIARISTVIFLVLSFFSCSSGSGDNDSGKSDGIKKTIVFDGSVRGIELEDNVSEVELTGVSGKRIYFPGEILIRGNMNQRKAVFQRINFLIFHITRMIHRKTEALFPKILIRKKNIPVGVISDRT